MAAGPNEHPMQREGGIGGGSPELEVNFNWMRDIKLVCGHRGSKKITSQWRVRGWQK